MKEAEARQEFENHACSDYPKRKREAFSQAAARIVREAPERDS
jgi:hypothetical protein